MSYTYLYNDQYEVLEDKKGACYVKDIKKNKFYYKKDLFASNRKGFTQKKVSWNLKDTIYTILMILSFILLIILIINYKKYIYIKLNTTMKTYALLFLIFNLFIHEIGHAFTLTFFGRKRGKYKFKIAFILPTISVDTSELYLLPKFEKICVCYAGIMNNIILCGLTVLFFPQYSYLVVCVIPLILFNALPFGGVQTDGYHIIINLMLGIRNYKNSESVINKILRYVFYIVSIYIFIMTLIKFIN